MVEELGKVTRSGVPDSGGSSAADSNELLVHFLALKRQAPTAHLAEAAGLPVVTASRQLEHLRNAGLAQEAPKGEWAATADAIKVLDGSRLHRTAPALAAEGRRHYERFEELDHKLKAAVTDWQLRPLLRDTLIVNDHSDPLYDDRVRTRIASLVTATLAFLKATPGWFRFSEAYGRRLSACQETIASRPQLIDAVRACSLHDIWMELHQDLRDELGLER
jgi:hypothetical protein